ncbi:MAG TPA: thiamine phosphate synthase [Polyangiales bacterium]
MNGLYAIVDPEHCAGREPLWVAEAILRGGCAALQLRAKRLGEAELRTLGRALQQACQRASVPLFVNDHVWLARELGAQGVHLGQDDLPVAEARRLLGSSVMIGLSTHSLAQAHAAEVAGADLIGFGPVFATQTKARAELVVGLAQLAEVCRAVSIPVVAIGGITLDTAQDVAQTGVQLAAAISALCGAVDPEQAAARMHQALRR